MSDLVRVSPAQSFGACEAATEYVADVYREGQAGYRDVNGFYAPLERFLETTIEQRFMNPQHRALWTSVPRVEDVLPTIRATPDWDANARDYAAVR